MATLLTGATGFVGQKLIPLLDAPVFVCSRNASRAKQRFGDAINGAISWNPTTEDLNLDSIDQLDAVVNLMGEPIAGDRWTTEKKRRIFESRITGTRRLVDAMIDSNKVPKVLVSASAIGVYGDRPNEVVTELAEIKSFVKNQNSNQSVTFEQIQDLDTEGFKTTVCSEWERETDRLSQHGTRVVKLRIGIVLGRESGALAELVPIFKWGIAGRLGSGKQYMAWVHVDDLVRLIKFCTDSEDVVGPVNATAPNPVTNSEFTRTLAKQLGRPAFIPAPKFGVRLLVGEFANSLFFSQNVVPQVALEQGFDFHFENLETAIADLV